MRKLILAPGEYYHVFNRGVDKRDIFMDEYDLKRFLLCLIEFNTFEPIGSIYENRFKKPKHGKKLGSLASKSRDKKESLTELICYCLNPNHFHLVLFQKQENAIQRFMQRLGTGYTNYFNEKYSRSGSLFQGPYKAVHIESNTQLLHTSVYVNLNGEISGVKQGKFLSSWGEYVADAKPTLCKKDIVLGQFKNPSKYKSFARSSLKDIIRRKREQKELSELLGS